MTALLGAEVRAVARNLLFKGLSSSLEKVCRLALVIAAAPVLGQTTFGRFQLATTVTTMLALGTDLGLSIWTTRELARSRERAGTIVGTTLRARALASLPYAAAVAAVAAVVGPGEGRAAVLLFGVSALASAFVDHFAAILRGHERFADEARLNTARALLVLGLGLGALWLGRTLPWLVAGITAGTLISAVHGLARIIHGPTEYDRRGASSRRSEEGASSPAVTDERRTDAQQIGGQTTEAHELSGLMLLRPALGGPFDGALARTALRQSLPIWMAGMLSLLYFKGDTILLGWLAGAGELGAYGAAFKVFEGSQILPAMVMAAVFPSLARARGGQERWERLTAAALLGAGLLVGLCFYAARGPIVSALFGAGFTRAVPSLGVLALGVPLMYLNCGLTHFLIARDLGRFTLIFAASLLILNVAINLFAIPRWGGPGAAWATVLTEVALTAACLVALRATASFAPARSSS